VMDSRENSNSNSNSNNQISIAPYTRATEALESEPIRRYKNSSYKDESLSVS